MLATILLGLILIVWFVPRNLLIPRALGNDIPALSLENTFGEGQ